MATQYIVLVHSERDMDIWDDLHCIYNVSGKRGSVIIKDFRHGVTHRKITTVAEAMRRIWDVLAAEAKPRKAVRP